MDTFMHRAIEDIEKADGLMFAMESAYLGMVVPKDQLELADKAESTFYLLWDLVKDIEEDLTAIEKEQNVHDAIYEAKLRIVKQ